MGRRKAMLNKVWKYLIYFVMFATHTSAIAEKFDTEYSEIQSKKIVGRLWIPDTSNQSPGILLIGGSGGGYENQDAKWLSSLGFVVLNVRYFGAEGLPENLVHVPIEYFNSAVAWLNNHKAVEKNAIAIFGHSRGTEAALLVAYHNPLIKSVVVRSPSSIVWQGPGWSGFNESAWTWNNEPVDFHNVGLRDGAVWLSRILRNKKLIRTRRMFENALADHDSVKRARLPVENINANLLLLSGVDDQNWPSSIMAEMLVSILDESDFQLSYKHVAFNDAGHRPARQSTPDDTFANGGTKEGNIEAHKQTKVLVKAFLDETLR